MKLRGILFLIFAGSLTGCQWGSSGEDKPAITTDTLQYTYKIIKQKAPDCRDKPDSNCVVAQIKYPLFLNQKALNDTISHRLLMQFGIPGKADNTLQQLTDQFLKAGKDFRLNSNSFVIREDSSILLVQVSGYRFLGGARGYYLASFINWNTKAQREIALGDILKDGYVQDLNSIAEKIFRKQEKVADSVPLKGYLFENGKFSLSNNFLITPIGLRFLYNQYEIKPYPAAETNLLIPYSQIESLLRPNTVVTQYYK
ncbi:MAG TPA: RsiV family protein [Mucilaginibacter sp.]|jgi:hypothetical protein|nr:RsiV family protein [Mucilaginibacter sp.]